MKRFKFTVIPKHTQGALDFPFDMLRYDRCYPITPLSARAIGVAGRAASAMVHKSGKAFQGTIELQSNDVAPSSKRWESQGWLVTNVESFRQ